MKNIKKMIALLLVAITVLAIAAPALAYTKKAVSGTRYITSSNGGDVNVRIGPGTSYKKANIGQFAVGTKVTLKYEAKDSGGSYWYDVTNSDGKGGWVKSTYLTKTAPTGSGGGGSTGGETTTFPWSVSTNTSGTYGNAVILNGWNCIYEEPPTIDGVHVEDLVTGSRYTVANYNGNYFKFNAPSDGSIKFLLRTNVDNSYCKMSPKTLFGSGTLALGSSGSEVTTLQHYLNRYLGYRKYVKITVDGSYGSTTKAKVESFQTYMNTKYKAGLKVDGIVGSETGKWLACFVQNECQ